MVKVAKDTIRTASGMVYKGTVVEDDDPLVKKYPWLYVAPEELIAPEPFVRKAPEVEAATAAPGEKRATKPRPKTKKK